MRRRTVIRAAQNCTQMRHLRVNDLLSPDFTAVASTEFLYRFYERPRVPSSSARMTRETPRKTALFAASSVGRTERKRGAERAPRDAGTKDEKTVPDMRAVSSPRRRCRRGTQKGLQFPNHWISRLVGVASANGTGCARSAGGRAGGRNESGAATNSSESRRGRHSPGDRAP